VGNAGTGIRVVADRVAVLSTGVQQTLLDTHLFARLYTFRRLVNRWEYHVENFLGMVQLGCLKLLARYL
jgi:hypothetical protein